MINFQLQKLSCTLLDNTKILYGGRSPVSSGGNQHQVLSTQIKIEPIATAATTTTESHQQQQAVPLFRTVNWKILIGL